MLDAFGPYEPEKMRKPERYTPSVHIFRSTKIRKHLAIAVAPGAVATRATHTRARSGSRHPLAEPPMEGVWSTKICAPLVLRSPLPVHGGLGD